MNPILEECKVCRDLARLAHRPKGRDRLVAHLLEDHTEMHRLAFAVRHLARKPPPAEGCDAYVEDRRGNKTPCKEASTTLLVYVSEGRETVKAHVCDFHRAEWEVTFNNDSGTRH